MVIGKECSPGRGPHFSRCHTDESPGHLLASQTSQSRQLAALSDWTARKHLTRSAQRADRRCPQPFVDGSSLPPAGQNNPGPGVRRPTREVVAVRARPERPLAPCPGRLADARSRPNQALRDVRPFSAARKNRNSPRHRPTGKSPSLSPGHWSAGARAQGPFSVGRPASTPGWALPNGHDARSNRTSAPPSLPHGRRNAMRQKHFRRRYGTHGALPRVTHLGGPGGRGAINPAHCDTTGFRPHNSGQAVTGNMGGLSIR